MEKELVRIVLSPKLSHENLHAFLSHVNMKHFNDAQLPSNMMNTNY